MVIVNTKKLSARLLWAKTGSWGEDSDEYRRIYLIGIVKSYYIETKFISLSFIFGPINLIFGYLGE